MPIQSKLCSVTNKAQLCRNPLILRQLPRCLPSFLSPPLPWLPKAGCQWCFCRVLSSHPYHGQHKHTRVHMCVQGERSDAQCQGGGLPTHSNLHNSQTWRPALCVCVFTHSHFLAQSSSPRTMGLILGSIKQQQKPLESGGKGGKQGKDKGHLFKGSNCMCLSSRGFYKLLNANYSCKRSLPISLHPVCRCVGLSQWFKS